MGGSGASPISVPIRIKRGLDAAVAGATFNEGEPAFTTDTYDFYVGTAAGKQKFLKDGASHTALSDIGTNTHAQIDTFIGTTVPATYLPLAGGVMTGNLLMTSNKIIGGSTATSDLFLQTTAGVGATGADMHFLVGNNGATEAMTILNSGNVGIGTTAPGYKLDVAGDFRTTSSAWLGSGLTGQGLYVKSTGNVGIGTTGPVSKLTVHTGTNINANFRTLGVGANGLDMWAGNDAGSAYVPLSFNGSKLVLNSDSSGGVSIGYNDPGTAKLAIDGNVGIGTTAPSSKLEVVGGAEFNGTNASGYIAEMQGTVASGGFKQYGNNVQMLAYHGQVNALTVGSSYFGTVPSNGGAIFSGNVGIGTTSPADLLSLEKATTPIASVNWTDTTSYGGFRFKEGGATAGSVQMIGSTFATTSRRNNIELFNNISTGGIALHVNNSATPGFLLNSSGNVGIGTTAPTAKAHIDQASTTAAIPALLLGQADVSEEMIEIVSTAGVGNAIEAVGAKNLTTTEFIKVTINGNTRYIPAGTIA